MNNRLPKRIGLIGGLSPESTLYYYSYICREFNKRCGELHFPEIAIQRLNLQRLMEMCEVNDWEGVASVLLDALHSLKDAGAEFAAILTNTPHNAYDRIREESPLDIITIMDATCDALIRDGRQQVALIGTRATMERGLFQSHFRSEGLDTLTPDQERGKELDHIIWEELAHGKIKSESRVTVMTIIHELVDRGAEAVVLGCTELSILITHQYSPIPLYDTTTLHAKSILKYAMHE